VNGGLTEMRKEKTRSVREARRFQRSERSTLRVPSKQPLTV
jgi:hypothetical protein